MRVERHQLHDRLKRRSDDAGDLGPEIKIGRGSGGEGVEKQGGAVTLEKKRIKERKVNSKVVEDKRCSENIR